MIKKRFLQDSEDVSDEPNEIVEITSILLALILCIDLSYSYIYNMTLKNDKK